MEQKHEEKMPHRQLETGKPHKKKVPATQVGEQSLEKKIKSRMTR
jgi:hypothetical protein